jgi:hypothetical protein
MDILHASSRILTIVWFVLTPSLAAAGEKTPTQADITNVLQAEFPDAVSALVHNGKYAIRYCPDNTCEAFESCRAQYSVEASDFALLYLVYFSRYAVLENWKPSENTLRVAKRVLARKRYSSCRREIAIESARCVLVDLNSERVRANFVRIDEDAVSRTPMDVRKELHRRTLVKRALN